MTGTLCTSGKAILKKGEGRTIKAGGAWVFDNEIARTEGTFADGEIIAVEDFDGYFMGWGFYNSASKIRIRMLARRREEPIDEGFIRQRVRDAWNYRKQVIDTSSCRVIFGEADWLPGLVVDKYEDILVVESLALGIDRLKLMILDELKAALAEDGIKVRGIYERSAIWSMLPKARRPAFSWIRSSTVWPCRDSAMESGCWTALPIWEPLL